MSTITESTIYARVRSATLDPDSTPRETASFLGVVLDYTFHLRETEEPANQERKAEELTTAGEFLNKVTQAHVWPLVQQMTEEYRHPM